MSRSLACLTPKKAQLTSMEKIMQNYKNQRRQILCGMRGNFFLAFLLVLGLSARFAAAAPISGTVYTVNSTTDTGTGTGNFGDLRYVLTLANSTPGSTILFQNNLGTITLTSGLPPISASVTVNGGTGNTITGTGVDPLFTLSSGTISFDPLTIQGSPGAAGATGTSVQAGVKIGF